MSLDQRAAQHEHKSKWVCPLPNLKVMSFSSHIQWSFIGLPSFQFFSSWSSSYSSTSHTSFNYSAERNRPPFHISPSLTIFLPLFNSLDAVGLGMFPLDWFVRKVLLYQFTIFTIVPFLVWHSIFHMYVYGIPWIISCKCNAYTVKSM